MHTQLDTKGHQMTKTKDPQAQKLVDNYAKKILPLLPLAKKAFGSRGTDSPQHDASRKYTSLLVDFYALGGSLLVLSEAIGVTYAGVRRRVTTAEIAPTTRRSRTRYTEEQYSEVLSRVLAAKQRTTFEYHSQLKTEYDLGVSLNHLAKLMGLSSANPLYYGVSRITLRQQHAR